MCTYLGLSIADTCKACSVGIENYSHTGGVGIGDLFAGARLGAAASVLTLTTNLAATISVGYKTW